MLVKVASLNIPMCVSVEFGTCADGVYSLQSWINGEDLEAILPLLPETEQYVLGMKSGEILRKMHAIPAPETQEKWALRFNRKIVANLVDRIEVGLDYQIHIDLNINIEHYNIQFDFCTFGKEKTA